MSQVAGISGRRRSELARVLSSTQHFVTPNDVVTILNLDPDAAAKRLARWAKDGWLRRVRRGLYIAVPVGTTSPSTWTDDALVVANEVWAPCYFSGWTSANYWGLSEQVFRSTVVRTTARVRESPVTLLDHDYLVSHVREESMTWGLSTEWRGATRLLFADPARTMVEILDSPRIGGGIRNAAEILNAYLDEYDPKMLIEFGDRLENRAVFKRLGYLIEATHHDLPDAIMACQERISTGISALDSSAPNAGRRAMKWGLRINVHVGPEDPS
jgi:predicted transcriptional regulator of viral defense system